MRTEYLIAIIFVLAIALFIVILALIHYQGKNREATDKVNYLHDRMKQEKENAQKMDSRLRDQLQVVYKSIDQEKENKKQLVSSYENRIRAMESAYNALSEEKDYYVRFYKNAQSNLTLFPYMAGIVSEFETRDIEELARKLDWGSNKEREKKVASIRLIRKEAQEKINQAKEAEYQLAYLFQLFPKLKDYVEYNYTELPKLTEEALSEERDNARNYLSKEEWDRLSVTERNQLALDRYVESRRKTNWQVGRDYEEYIGYTFREKGYLVDNYGSRMGLEDLGRDIIAKKDGKTIIIQCKYWSQQKQIHENHINQLFGTVKSYCIENDADESNVVGMLVTNTKLSENAKIFANRLGVDFEESIEIGNYPRIKCNIGRGECGSTTYIYHLPFDQQYDAAIISKPGEFYAMTVKDAEQAGFRRAYKWFGE